MARRVALAIAVAAILASPAFAGGGFIPQPAVKIIKPAPPEPPRGPISSFFGRLFSPRDAHLDGTAAFDTSAPAPGADGLLPPPPKVRALSAADVPLPRLRPRPTRFVEAGAAAGLVVLGPIPPPVSVTYETTASIPAEAPPVQPMPVAIAPPAAVSPPAAEAVPAVVTASAAVAAPPAIKPPAPPPVREAEAEPAEDDLLGDVTTYFAPESHEMDPDAPAPAQVDLSLPPSAGAAIRTLPGVNLKAAAKPYELVRALQIVQDQIAQGSTNAITAQRGLRAEIDKQFAAADPSVWQDRRNAEAAVTYVLSGGAPAILGRLAKLDPKPAIDMRLVTGVLAYAEGREADAANDLADIDPMTLPASMGAQMALAQSALAVRASPEKAMHLLSTARLLAPGTLVEEAAIRRQLFVANQLKQDDMVEQLSRQYLDRFRHSVYAGNFRQRFAAAIGRMDINDDGRFARLDDILASVEPEARCQLYLTVALASAIKSRFVAARLAADRAVALTASGSPEEARARLYAAAAEAADPKTFDKAAADYAIVDRDLLRASDQAMADVVGLTLAGIRSGTDRQSMPAAAALPPADPVNDAPSPIVARASDALKGIDEILLAAK